MVDLIGLVAPLTGPAEVSTKTNTNSGHLRDESTVANTSRTEVLIHRVQQGSEEALQELLSRYQTRVLAAVRLRLGVGLRRKLESNDIAQEAFIDALRHVKDFEFKTEGAFLHYLNRVVANKIRDEADRWRAKKREATREVPFPNARSSDLQNPLINAAGRSAATPSETLGLGEDLARLEKAIDRLGEESDESRELIIAVKLEGRSFREIAEEMGKSPDAIRMQANRAMAALTRIFQQIDDD